MCDPKIFTYNCVFIDLKLHLDRFRSSDLSLVTFLELMKGGLKREIFGWNLGTVSRSARGKNGRLVSFIIGHVIRHKLLNSLLSVKMRGNESTDKKCNETRN